SPSLDPKLTVEENLLHQGHLYQLSRHKLKERIEKNLEKFDIDDRKEDRVETLSGGLQRRVEIAKALLHEPRLLLFDEPTTGLDPGVRRAFWDDLKKLQKEGVSILVTTHFIEEADRCDRVAILDQGRCVAIGTPESLKKAIRGDVISVKTRDTAFLKQAIEEKFGVTISIVDGMLHIEKQEGSDFMMMLIKAFPNEIDSVTISKPSLEDVFIQKTGKRFLEQT
ncbi:MAG: ATP-binding cassette domain-containing protein, partial [Deltaproteobacteria bacterium]